jgi:aminomethyltransferase
MEVAIEDVLRRIGCARDQGPLSRRDSSLTLTPADLSQAQIFPLVETTCATFRSTISRTGYTGDLGYEIWVDAATRLRLWDALIEAGRLRHRARRSVGARLARIEAG